MNKSAVWGVVIVAILVVAGLLAWRTAGPQGEPVPTNTLTPPVATLPIFTTSLPSPSPVASPTLSPTLQAEAATLSMTDTGFSPQTLTVAGGATVTFVNNGQALHWPASALHPTHQILPGFDSRRGLATGETYSFTFTKPGSWNCHDHLNPTFTCTIVVN